MSSNPGPEMPAAVWAGPSPDSQPILREEMASGAPQPQGLGPDLRVRREEAQPRQPQHAPLNQLPSSHPLQEGSAPDASQGCTLQHLLQHSPAMARLVEAEQSQNLPSLL